MTKSKSKINDLCLNGHETYGELAQRHLRTHLQHLREMRWMMTCDFVALTIYDDGIAKLAKSLETLDDRISPIPIFDQEAPQ